MKKVVLIAVASLALAAGPANTQSPQNSSQLPAADTVPTSQLYGSILDITADKITIWDGITSYIFALNADTTCGPNETLSVADLEAGDEVTVFYTWQRGPLPTAVHIEPAML